MNAPAQSISIIRANLCDRIAQHMESAWRELVTGPKVSSERGFFRIVSGEPHPLGNCAIVADADAFESVKKAIAPLVAGTAPACVIFPFEPPSDVEKLLASSGFTATDAMPTMGIDIGKIANTSLPDGYSFRRIGTMDEVGPWVSAMATGFDVPRSLCELFAPSDTVSVAPDATVQYFAILHGGQTVATSMLFLNDGMAGVYCVSTLPDERGKGLGAHVTAEPLRLAQAAGYKVGVLQASAAGYPVYKRLGFEDFGGLPMYVRVLAS